ncbi:DUF4349 domain-containing protein [Gracilibacillus sp. YIM 98692]|uniref:DUF4349 domain-containing protein n=1 Tax=Gracilibacillus sp. YIM 98692 TaxID=2663532 RepID=UPI0013D2C973|nr:DUF4349 domain-containing protein [Gracilibacillus sp. YIM 98692]
MKKYWFLGFITLILLLQACSNNQSSEDSYDRSNEASSDTASSGEMGFEEKESVALENRQQETTEMEEASDTDVEERQDVNGEERKIIYQANLSVETNTYRDTISFIEEKVEEYNGYLVSSESYGRQDKQDRRATMKLRIPANSFEEFLTMIEDGDINIMERSVRGKDVTEQYVDLDSRLKSKKVVEERLLSFMEEAEKTEDLLKISEDLAKVQEEIEQLTGKIRYLENQSDFATIDIRIIERDIQVASVQDESLNTWEKTKEQFMKSINFIITAASSLFIFTIGNLPIFIFIAIILAITWIIIKRKTKPKSTS